METTRPGIGHSSSFDVSGGGLNSICAANAATRGRRTLTTAVAPRWTMRKRSERRETCIATAWPATSPEKTLSPGFQLLSTSIIREALPSPRRTAITSRPSVIVLAEYVSARFSVTVQSRGTWPTPFSWPEILRRRSSSRRCMKMAAEAMRSFSSAVRFAPWKPSLNSSAMKFVDKLPARKRAWPITACRNGMLWAIPSIEK